MKQEERMDPRSGKIVKVKDEAEARRRGLVPIPEEELAKVQGMSPEARKDWVNRKLGRFPSLAPLPNLAFNLNGAKDERNAAKRQRRARKGR